MQLTDRIIIGICCLVICIILLTISSNTIYIFITGIMSGIIMGLVYTTLIDKIIIYDSSPPVFKYRPADRLDSYSVSNSVSDISEISELAAPRTEKKIPLVLKLTYGAFTSIHNMINDFMKTNASPISINDILPMCAKLAKNNKLDIKYSHALIYASVSYALDSANINSDKRSNPYQSNQLEHDALYYIQKANDILKVPFNCTDEQVKLFTRFMRDIDTLAQSSTVGINTFTVQSFIAEHNTDIPINILKFALLFYTLDIIYKYPKNENANEPDPEIELDAYIDNTLKYLI